MIGAKVRSVAPPGALNQLLWVQSWSDESPEEAALFTEFLVRVRVFFQIVLYFIALQREGGKIAWVGVPER